MPAATASVAVDDRRLKSPTRHFETYDITGHARRSTLTKIPDVVWPWSYSQQGANWLADEGLCTCTGNRQSPIDIVSDAELKGEVVMLQLDYLKEEPPIFDVVNNGRTIQVHKTCDRVAADHGAEPGCYGSCDVTVEGGQSRRYRVVQFHFHAPAEHTFQGQRRELELHIVHQAGDNPSDLLVVGVTFVKGEAPSAFLDSLISLPRFPPATAERLRVWAAPGEQAVTLSRLFADLKEAAEFYHYKGSLTTPPCTENVLWFVKKQPATANAEQLSIFTKTFLGEDSKGNYRAAQHNKEPVSLVRGVARLL